MLRIPCPFCGERDESEFHYGGEPKPRPGPAEAVDDATWGAYLHDRGNAKGPHEEIWHHLGGCRRVFLCAGTVSCDPRPAYPGMRRTAPTS